MTWQDVVVLVALVFTAAVGTTLMFLDRPATSFVFFVFALVAFLSIVSE